MIEQLAIKDAIKHHGTSVQEVAGRMGISRVTLSTHINGNPSVEILLRIADAIGCPVTELFTPAPGASSEGFVCPKCGAKLKITLDRE